MARSILLMKQWLFLAACLLYTAAMTGCSAVQTGHFSEPEMALSPQAVASADDEFVSAPFSLVASDSIGLATFGYEIAQWADDISYGKLAQNN